MLFKKQTPKPGETWRLKSSDGDPFENKYPAVRVLEIRSGWVRYRISSMFPDERKAVNAFVGMYDFVA